MDNLHILNQSKEKNLRLLNKIRAANIENLPLRYAEKDFSNFIVNDNNKNIVEKIKNSNDSFILTGKSGTGKTHLAIAKCKSLLPKKLTENEKNRNNRILTQRDIDYAKDCYSANKSCYQYSGEDILKYITYLEQHIECGANDYRSQKVCFLSVAALMMGLNELAMKGEGKLNELNNYIWNYDYLILDDLGAEKLTDASRQNLYYLIDERYKNMKAIIITSNYTIEQINDIEPRIASRLAEMGVILKLNGDDYRTSN